MPSDATKTETRAKLNAEPCHCERCDWCHGSGRFPDRESWSGLETEPCEECGGSGITETCDRCQLLIEMDYEDNA